MKDVDLHTVVKRYVGEKYPSASVPDLAVYITALISPKPSQEFEDLSNLINLTLYKFNKHRLAELL